MSRADMSVCGAPCCAETAPGVGPVLQGREHEYFPDAVNHKGYKHLSATGGFCSKLTPQKTCAIYRNRPQVCKDYSCQINHGCFEG